MKVGVTYRNYGPRNEFGKPLHFSGDYYRDNNYVSFVLNAGHIPVIISEQNIQSMSECQALLLGGGIDVHPGNYGITPEFPKENYDQWFDELEQVLLMHCIQNKKPIFGICRGHQMISLYLNSMFNLNWDWVQELPGHLNRPVKKWKKWFCPKPLVRGKDLYHDVLDISNSSVLVNSSHHQGMRLSGSRVVSLKDTFNDGTCIYITHLSSDGIIEGLDFPRYRIQSVQWHPERFINPQALEKNGTPEILRDFLMRWEQ